MRLIADGLGQRYGRRVLFRNLSFELDGGQSLAITGANGSGKSTLVRILAGLLTPTRGEARLVIEGHAVEGAALPFQCGLVAPYLNLYAGLTAFENLRFLTRARQEPHLPLGDALRFVGLDGRGHDPVATYSSGMVQRVRLAAAVLFHPAVLLLDEPSSNLDAAGIAVVERVVERQRAAGRLLVVATNDAREAALCERVLRVEDYGA